MPQDTPPDLIAFTRRYTAALTVLAVLATTKFAWFEMLGIEDGQAESLVNLAGRQRMLAQRIAYDGLRLAHATSEADARPAQEDLASAIDRMQREHDSLLSALPALPVSEPSRALVRLYGYEGLNARVDAYLGLAREVSRLPTAALSPEAPAILELEAGASPELFASLEAAVSLYEDGANEARWWARLVNIGSFVAVLGVLAGLAWRVFGPMARLLRTEAQRLALAERTQREAVDQNAFMARLHTAFDMVQTEEDVVDLVGEALRDTAPGLPAALLLADATRARLDTAHVAPGAPPAGCVVDSPMACSAIRRGHALRFASSAELDSCPCLRRADAAPRAAVCFPLAFLGEPIGVLHVWAPVGLAPDGIVRERLEAVAAQAANRLGTVRSFDAIARQAATDPLTGLLNRRALEARVRRLVATGAPYAVVMADLDHFKRLNDEHGHDAGDRALRTFARVLADSLRAEDAAARYGGEEFIVVIPHGTLEVGLAAADRLRARLRSAVEGGTTPSFTASFGVAEGGGGAAFAEVLRAADLALLAAKAGGRDRACTAGPPQGALVEFPQASA